MKYVKNMKIEVVTPFDLDISYLHSLIDYIKSEYKIKGVKKVLQLFNGSMVAILKEKTPSDAFLVNDETEIEIENERIDPIYIL